MQNSRIVRRQYRTILTNIQDQQLELRETTSKLTQKIIDANHLFETVQNAQDATMDATLLLTTAEYASEKISKISAGKQKISLDEFVSLVNWDLVTVTSKAIFPCGFMHLAAEPKPKAVRQRPTRLVKDMSKFQMPVQLTESDIKRDENETTNAVQKVLAELRLVEPISFFRFVINPASFGQSVENLFHLSFLVRDSLVTIEEDEHGDLIVATAEPPTDQDMEDADCSRIQNIFNLDMALWKRLICTFNITESVIPHRYENADTADFKWYA